MEAIKNSSNFTVYHATGTIFLDSIKKNGLKNYSLDKQYKLIEALKKLYNCIPDEQKERPDFDYKVRSSNSTIRFLIKQDEPLYMNGPQFATTSLKKAKEFALSRTKGSELLTTVFHLYNFCNSNGWFGKNEIGEKFKSQFNELINLLDIKSNPIILCFETNLSSVASEEGTNSEEYFAWLQGLDEDYLENIGESLRITQPSVIPSSVLQYYEYIEDTWRGPFSLCESQCESDTK
ncbi:hypothetical protein QM360_05920 [Streptococcus cristatus]|uniref:hypothetical protein n=1 Tax=Streptococcus cristatus TaxID=45634 RepID=UPI0039C30566